MMNSCAQKETSISEFLQEFLKNFTTASCEKELYLTSYS